MPLNHRSTNLHQLPEVINYHYTHVSVGDLHGNALKLIYTLIEEGVLELSEEEQESSAHIYIKLRDIYNKPINELRVDDLAKFQDIINKAKVNKNKAVTLIGDELADRGNNDYFTLLVLQKLKEEQVNIEIMLSNHSVEFIRDYENKEFTGQYYLGSS
jgi:hypothetical protein